MLHENTERKLLSLLKEGNEIALSTLYRQHIQQLYHFVLRTVKSPDLANDVVQDVFVRIWENREQIDASRPFKPYLYIVARRHMLNLLKRAQHEAMILAEITLHSSCAENTTELQTEYKESRSLLRQAVDQLTPQSRAIFIRCRLEGLTYRQVAEELGIKEGTVNTQMVRALKSIRKFLSLRNAMVLAFLCLSFVLRKIHL